VTRYFARKDLLLEISLVVPIPPQVPVAEGGDYARARMDEFMGAISLP
jgi:hypothetical protein